MVHGDRVLLLMQNSPQFIIGYYGILRANAVVVPLNPMSVTQELATFVADIGRAHASSSRRSSIRAIEPLLRDGLLEHVIVAAYSDYLQAETDARRAGLHHRAAPAADRAGGRRCGRTSSPRTASRVR